MKTDFTPLQKIVALRTLAGAAFFIFIPFLPVWLRQSSQISTPTIAFLTGVTLFASRGGSIILPFVLRKMAVKTALLGSYGSVFLSFFLVGFDEFKTEVFLFLLLPIAGLGFSAGTLVIKSYITNTLTSQERLRAFSFLSVAINSSAAAGSALSGLIVAWKPDLLPFISALMLIFAITVILTFDSSGKVDPEGSRPETSWPAEI